MDIYFSQKLKLQRGALSEKCLLYFDGPVSQLYHNVILVKWTPPAASWVKLNADGASSGNHGVAGAGGLLRNSKHIGFLLFNWYPVFSFCRHMQFWLESERLCYKRYHTSGLRWIQLC